jgi:transposase-like protein
MRARFTQSFKVQAVEKVLGRSDSTSVREVAETLGIGQSTLQKWIAKSRSRAFESISNEGTVYVGGRGKEKRPQDWSPEEKLANGHPLRCP